MKATLCLEYIGWNNDQKMRLYSYIVDFVTPGLAKELIGHKRRNPWVAKVSGTDKRYGFKREFISGKIQLKRANRAFTRGVELWFVLESGNVYEVSSPESWRYTRRYFCIVNENGDILHIKPSEVESWLKKA